MKSLTRFMLIFPLGVWVGGIIFFSFIVAPALFAMLPKPGIAAAIIGVSLTDLHLLGIACGLVALVGTFIVKPLHPKGLRTLLAVMLVLTTISLFGIMPQMQRIRESVGGSIEALPPQDAGRAAFDRLHKLSVGLEGIVLLAGISSLALLSRET